MYNKVGVVVPIYRSKKYILECFDSVLNEQNPFFHFILVDDGCPDNTLDYLIENRPCVAQSPYFHIIRKSNGGVSSARNSGVSYAKKIGCDFICFIDSDDYVVDSFFENLYEVILNYEFDVFEFEFIRGKEDVKDSFLRKNRKFDVSSDVKSIQAAQAFTDSRWHLCRRLFKTSLFEVDCFEKDIVFEDMAFCLKLYSSQTLKIISTNFPMYVYRINPMSITRSKLDADGIKLYLKSFLRCLEIASHSSFRDLSSFHIAFTAATYGIDLPIQKIRSYIVLRDYIFAKRGFLWCKMTLFFIAPKIYAMVYKKIKRSE